MRDVNESKWNACVTFAVSSSPKRNKSRLLKIYFPVFPEILTIYFDDFPEILTIYEILLFWSESRLGEISGHNRLLWFVTFDIFVKIFYSGVKFLYIGMPTLRS